MKSLYADGCAQSTDGYYYYDDFGPALFFLSVLSLSIETSIQQCVPESGCTSFILFRKKKRKKEREGKKKSTRANHCNKNKIGIYIFFGGGKKKKQAQPYGRAEVVH